MKLKATFLLFLFLTTSPIVFAEYRVFKLQFVNAKKNTTRQILSTLDPEQYKTIFPLSNGEAVTYVQTWRCQGSTNQFKAYCQSPVLK